MIVKRTPGARLNFTARILQRKKLSRNNERCGTGFAMTQLTVNIVRDQSAFRRPEIKEEASMVDYNRERVDDDAATGTARQRSNRMVTGLFRDRESAEQIGRASCREKVEVEV